MRKYLFIAPLCLALSCQQKTVGRTEKMNAVAEKYVRLGFTIGQYAYNNGPIVKKRT